MSEQLTIALADEAATHAFGARLAAIVGPGVILLRGDLGAGKTCLVRGLLRGLGYLDRVKSPTYTLVEPYSTERLAVSHWDLYRLRAPGELDALGLREHARAHELLLIEWPERGGRRLADFDLELNLDYAGDGRIARLRAGSVLGQRWITDLSR